MQQRTYLDHAATAPVRREAVAAMTAELSRVGNPSSLHTSGRDARRVLEESREQLAAALGAQPAEVIFTSGATEADNLIITGAVRARRSRPAETAGAVDPDGAGELTVVTSSVEHHAVLETAQALAAAGQAHLEVLEVDRDGLIDRDRLSVVLGEGPAAVVLVSVMWANNETGVVQPMREIAALARDAGVLIHSDAVQAVGHLPIDFAGSGLDALSLSAHKFGGPVGIGALLARKEIRLAPVQYGGGQERDLRSGTLDVAAAAGCAAAITVAMAELADEAVRLRTLREKLITGVLAVDGTGLNGLRRPESSLPGIANLGFAGCAADDLLMMLDRAGIDCSTGSACTAGVSQPSHVLEAMGRSRSEAASALRFSLGHGSSEADVDRLLAVLPEAVQRARSVAGS